MQKVEIAIVGAGLAGLACAVGLRAQGHAPVLFDKSRGVGGRLSTRRADGMLRFDHGAQFVTARTTGFSTLLDEARTAGRAARWDDGSGETRIVGIPGMNALAKHMADGLSIRLAERISHVTRAADGWHIATGDETWACRRVVLAVPAPQARALLGEAHPLAQEIAAAEMAPCLALMVAFEGPVPAPFLARRDPDDALDWIALNSSKPGREDLNSWIAHGAPAWSCEHLERTPDEIAALMLPMLCERLGANPASAHHVAAHRWRFARVTTPLGMPFARDESALLYAGGDWCLGARAECAWESGTAIARDILGSS